MFMQLKSHLKMNTIKISLQQQWLQLCYTQIVSPKSSIQQIRKQKRQSYDKTKITLNN